MAADKGLCLTPPPIATTAALDAPTPSRAHSKRRSFEIPTLLLIFATWSAWLGVTAAYGHWKLWVVAPLTALLISLFSSLQHEIVHGHPTRWHALNRALGMVPLTLWLPYDRYRTLHRQHHIDARLTDPLDDPESFYWRAEDWAQLNPVMRGFLHVQQTLAGRILVGAFWRIGAFVYTEARAFVRNEPGIRSAWLQHLVLCVPIVAWLKLVCGMPVWVYFLGMVVPANGIQLIRSFAEHRARDAVRERIAIVEDSWILGPMFLFNNLHSLHHEDPLIPWYEYPARYRMARERLLRSNGGLVYRTYFDVMRRYLFTPHDRLLHPTGRAPVPPL
ncbi:MAG: fatty acid desaturase [Proteobacteria bacterium]|nr:fatty acid desaturase [Pseudomonadota bacterium]